MKSKLSTKIFTLLLAVITYSSFAQETKALEGKWNLIVTEGEKEVPSWLEIRHSGISTLVGQFCYKMGSARPVAEIKATENQFSFEIPPQWEPKGDNMLFEGKLVDNTLQGTMVYTDGKVYQWIGNRAPMLNYNANITWGKDTPLFNGKDLSGWKAMGENQWLVEDGILKSPKSGANLVTEQTYNDFKLKVEFRYPEGSNSGIYLRGRYEVQIADNIGLEASDVYFGGIYGHLTPNENMAKPAGEWQRFEITLIGRRVTVIANGKTIIQDQNIPGMTGGALDNDEASPGPILIQGDHGPIEFKSIVLTLAEE